MNDNRNTNYFNMLLFGMEYEKSIISKPEYWDLSGRLKKESVLKDLATNYLQMKDEKLIQKLIELKIKSAELVGKGNYCKISDVQIERQMLTNAYAFKHGASLVSVKQLCILDERILSYYYSALFIYSCYESYFKHRAKVAPAGLGDWINLEIYGFASEFLSRDSYLQYLDKNYRSSFVDYFLGRLKSQKYSLKTDSGQRMPDISFAGVEYILDKFYGAEVFKSICSNYASLKINLNDMLLNGQFPPYGVALSLDYEDEGQRVLPWHGKLSEQTIFELRRQMHAEAHGSMTEAYKAVLAAYCNCCFNTDPTFPMVKREFVNVKVHKSRYSEYVSTKIDEFRPLVERGFTARIDDLVRNEPFYYQYIELKEILKST